jgi:zinc transport system permease protein
MNELLLYTVLAAISLACTICPVGCIVLWKRIPYIGDAVSHAAILGVVGALALGVNVTLGVIVISLVFAFMLASFKDAEENRILVVVLAYSFFALGMFLLNFLPIHTQVDIFSYLFGDILLVSRMEAIVLMICAVVVVVWLCASWKNLLLISIDKDLALVDGVNVRLVEFVFLGVVAFLVGAFVKILGASLVASALVMPAIAARNLSSSPGGMLIASVLVGAISVLAGLGLSLYVDSPSGPSIVLMFALMFVISLFIRKHSSHAVHR